jgi:hypothetical protein
VLPNPSLGRANWAFRTKLIEVGGLWVIVVLGFSRLLVIRLVFEVLINKEVDKVSKELWLLKLELRSRRPYLDSTLEALRKRSNSLYLEEESYYFLSSYYNRGILTRDGGSSSSYKELRAVLRGVIESGGLRGPRGVLILKGGLLIPD